MWSTYARVCVCGEGVGHVEDDDELLAYAGSSRREMSAARVEGEYCRWW